MKHPILTQVLLLFLPLLLPAQKVTTSDEMELRKNEEVVSSVATADRHTYVFTVIPARPGTYSADDKATVYHYDSEMKLIDKKPLAKKKFDKSDFIFIRAFQFSGKIVLFGKADNDNTGILHVLMTEFDKSTLGLTDEFSDALQIPFEPHSRAPQCDYGFRFSPASTMLGISVTFQASAEKTRIVYQTVFLLADASLNAEKRMTRLSMNTDFDYRTKDFLVTDDAQLVVLESKTEHLEYPDKYWTDKPFMTKLLSLRPVDQLVHFARASREADTTAVAPIIKGALMRHTFLFQDNNSLYVSGLLYSRPPAPKDPNLKEFLFVQPLSFSARELPIEPENMVEVPAPLHKLLLDPGPIDTTDQKLGTSGDFNFSFGMHASDGSFLVAGEVYIDRNWPPFSQMMKDKNYTIKANVGGGYSISGPAHHVRTYRQLFIIRFYPDEGSLVGKVVAREMETPRETELTTPLRGPFADLFIRENNGEPVVMLMDGSGQAVSLRSVDMNGEQGDPFFSDTADHVLLVPEGPAQSCFVMRGTKSYFLLRME